MAKRRQADQIAADQAATAQRESATLRAERERAQLSERHRCAEELVRLIPAALAAWEQAGYRDIVQVKETVERFPPLGSLFGYKERAFGARPLRTFAVPFHETTRSVTEYLLSDGRIAIGSGDGYVRARTVRQMTKDAADTRWPAPDPGGLNATLNALRAVLGS